MGSRYTLQDLIPTTGKLNGIFRGVVEDNKDPDKRGRVRVRIFGLMTDKISSGDTLGIPREHLIWAEPMISTFGGAITGVGAFYVPVQGSHVFIFFENGNPQQPRYFASAPAIPTKEAEKDKGFNDPEGKWPDKDLLDEPDWNRLARDKTEDTIVEEKKDNLVEGVPVAIGTTVDTDYEPWDEPDPYYEFEDGGEDKSHYPYNAVIQTRNKLTVELDDTDDAVRFHLYHPSNSYLEINKDGNMVFRNTGDRYEIIGQERDPDSEGEYDKHNVYVMGDENITITNNATKLIEGDYILEVRGEYSGPGSGGTEFDIMGALGPLKGVFERKVHGKETKWVKTRSDTTTGENHNILASGNENYCAQGTQNIFSVLTQSLTTELQQKFNVKGSREKRIWGNDSSDVKGRCARGVLGMYQENYGGVHLKETVGFRNCNALPPHFVSSPTKVVIGVNPVGSNLGAISASLSGITDAIRSAMEPMLAMFSGLQNIMSLGMSDLFGLVTQILTPVGNALTSQFGSLFGDLFGDYQGLGIGDIFSDIFSGLEGIGFGDLANFASSINIGEITSLADYVMKEYSYMYNLITQVQDLPQVVAVGIINDAALSKNQPGMIIDSVVGQMLGNTAGTGLLGGINTLYMNANDMGFVLQQRLIDYRYMTSLLPVFTLPGLALNNYPYSMLSNSDGSTLLQNYGDGYGDVLPTGGTLEQEINNLNAYISNALGSCWMDQNGVFNVNAAIDYGFTAQATFITQILLSFTVHDLLVNPTTITIDAVQGVVVDSATLNDTCSVPTAAFTPGSTYNGSLGYAGYDYNYGEEGSYYGSSGFWYVIDQTGSGFTYGESGYSGYSAYPSSSGFWWYAPPPEGQTFGMISGWSAYPSTSGWWWYGGPGSGYSTYPGTATAGYFIDQSVLGELLGIAYSGYSGMSGYSGESGEYYESGWSAQSGFLDSKRMLLTIDQNFNYSSAYEGGVIPPSTPPPGGGSGFTYYPPETTEAALPGIALTAKGSAILYDAKYNRIPAYVAEVVRRNCESAKDVFNRLIALEIWANDLMKDVDFDTVNWEGKFDDWPVENIPAPSCWFRE